MKTKEKMKKKIFELRTVATYDSRYRKLLKQVEKDEKCSKLLLDLDAVSLPGVLERYEEIVQNSEIPNAEKCRLGIFDIIM